jgi:hypothetical protein
METMNDIEILERDLRTRFPRSTVTIDAPSDTSGIWYVDIRGDHQTLIVQWKPHQGFGLSVARGAYGEGADEIYSTIAQVENRVAELLEVPTGANEDSAELLRVVSTYNDMFGRLYEALLGAVGEQTARDLVMTVLASAESDEIWRGVFFDQYGRFDENMLIANVSALQFDHRVALLDEALNTVLSVELFEVAQHLDSDRKVDVFRFIDDQKASLESSSSGQFLR